MGLKLLLSTGSRARRCQGARFEVDPANSERYWISKTGEVWPDLEE